MDLFSITTPFGLLPSETQQALKEWKGEHEFYSSKGVWSVTFGKPYFDTHIAYRAKPLPLTKPSINWDHVAPEWKWLATNESGNSFLFKEKPSVSVFYWYHVDGCALALTFSSFAPGTCDWKDSLVERPMKDSVEDLL